MGGLAWQWQPGRWQRVVRLVSEPGRVMPIRASSATPTAHVRPRRYWRDTPAWPEFDAIMPGGWGLPPWLAWQLLTAWSRTVDLGRWGVVTGLVVDAAGFEVLAGDERIGSRRSIGSADAEFLTGLANRYVRAVQAGSDTGVFVELGRELYSWLDGDQGQ
jgi:hypothetical protein